MFELMAATDLPGLFCSECKQESLHLVQVLSIHQAETFETAPIQHPGLTRFRDQAMNHVSEKPTWFIQCTACYCEWEFKAGRDSSRRDPSLA